MLDFSCLAFPIAKIGWDFVANFFKTDLGEDVLEKEASQPPASDARVVSFADIPSEVIEKILEYSPRERLILRLVHSQFVSTIDHINVSVMVRNYINYMFTKLRIGQHVPRSIEKVEEFFKKTKLMRSDLNESFEFFIETTKLVLSNRSTLNVNGFLSCIPIVSAIMMFKSPSFRSVNRSKFLTAEFGLNNNKLLTFDEVGYWEKEVKQGEQNLLVEFTFSKELSIHFQINVIKPDLVKKSWTISDIENVIKGSTEINIFSFVKGKKSENIDSFDYFFEMDD